MQFPQPPFTQTALPSGVNARFTGLPGLPPTTGKVPDTVSLAVSMIQTAPVVATYAFVPSGETSTPTGLEPTGIVAITMMGEVSMTETVLESEFVTYALLPSGVNATRSGPLPTVSVAVTVLEAVSIKETVPEE